MRQKFITDGKVKIGSAFLPDRKRPSICVIKGNQCRVYGSFHNEEDADEFMDELAQLIICGKKEE